MALMSFGEERLTSGKTCSKAITNLKLLGNIFITSSATSCLARLIYRTIGIPSIYVYEPALFIAI